MTGQGHDLWVVRYYGDGDVSYHSFDGPQRDPRFAHSKSREVAEEAAAIANRQIRGMRAEAVRRDQAIREFDGGTSRHNPSVRLQQRLDTAEREANRGGCMGGLMILTTLVVGVAYLILPRLM